MTTWTQFQIYPTNYMKVFNFEHRQKLYMLYMLSEGGMYQFSILCCGITIIAIVINRPNRKLSNIIHSLVHNCSAAHLDKIDFKTFSMV